MTGAQERDEASLASNDERDVPDPVPVDSAPPAAGGPGRRRRILLAWCLVVVWAGVIWMLGGDDYSLADTSRTLEPWLEWLFGEIDRSTKWRLFHAIRKSAHFVEYALLALLTFRAALVSAGRNQLATASWVALFLVATLASADEARQAFSGHRTGSPVDVLIDVAGGGVATLGLLAILRRTRASEDPTTKPASA